MHLFPMQLSMRPRGPRPPPRPQALSRPQVPPLSGSVLRPPSLPNQTRPVQFTTPSSADSQLQVPENYSISITQDHSTEQINIESITQPQDSQSKIYHTAIPLPIINESDRATFDPHGSTPSHSEGVQTWLSNALPKTPSEHHSPQFQTPSNASLSSTMQFNSPSQTAHTRDPLISPLLPPLPVCFVFPYFFLTFCPNIQYYQLYR